MKTKYALIILVAAFASTLLTACAAHSQRRAATPDSWTPAALAKLDLPARMLVDSLATNPKSAPRTVAGMYGDVTQLETLLIFWQNMERTHYPFAHDNVERIKMLIEKQQIIQQLQAENAGLKTEVQNRADYSEYLKQKLLQNGGLNNGGQQ